MKNKHPHAVAVLVLGLAMAGLHLADLLLWSEADTGFAAAGSVWLRYIPWLAAFALPYLPARRAAAQPAGLQDTNKPLGVCMALAGAVLLASGVAAGNTARYAILYPEVLSGSCPVWAAWADLLLPIFAGAWLLNYAVRAFSGFGLQRQRLGSSLLAGAVPLVFLWRLIWRFQFAPASLCRMPLHAAGAERCRRTAAGCGADQNFSCAGSALRAYALRGGDGCVPALHRTGAAPDPV